MLERACLSLFAAVLARERARTVLFPSIESVAMARSYLFPWELKLSCFSASKNLSSQALILIGVIWPSFSSCNPGSALHCTAHPVLSVVAVSYCMATYGEAKWIFAG